MSIKSVEIWGETSLVTYGGKMVASTSTTLQLVRVLDMRCHCRLRQRKNSGDWVEGNDEGGQEKKIYKIKRNNNRNLQKEIPFLKV